MERSNVPLAERYPSSCVHLWRIGEAGRGVCWRCGAERTFLMYLDERASTRWLTRKREPLPKLRSLAR